MHTWYPERSEESITVKLDGCESPWGFWESKPDPLWGKCVLLTIERDLSSIFSILNTTWITSGVIFITKVWMMTTELSYEGPIFSLNTSVYVLNWAKYVKIWIDCKINWRWLYYERIHRNLGVKNSERNLYIKICGGIILKSKVLNDP